MGPVDGSSPRFRFPSLGPSIILAKPYKNASHKNQPSRLKWLVLEILGLSDASGKGVLEECCYRIDFSYLYVQASG